VLSGFPDESDVDRPGPSRSPRCSPGRPSSSPTCGAWASPSSTSRPVRALTGYAPDDALGRDLGFLLRNDTDQDGVREAREAVRDGRAITVTLRNYRADGSLFWCEQRHHPLRDGAAAQGHLVTVLRDVTDQVNARSAEAAVHELASSLSGDGAWFAYGALVDASGGVAITWVGQACRFVLGVESSGLLGTGLVDHVLPEDRADVLARWAALRGDGGSRRDRYRVRAANGKVRLVEDFAAVSWSAPEAGVVALHGVLRDVGGRGRAQGRGRVRRRGRRHRPTDEGRRRRPPAAGGSTRPSTGARGGGGGDRARSLRLRPRHAGPEPRRTARPGGRASAPASAPP
jgi:PAS domain S-box-containing protein